MKKGDSIYIAIIAVLVIVVLYLLYSNLHKKTKVRNVINNNNNTNNNNNNNNNNTNNNNNNKNKKRVTIDENKNKVYLIDGTVSSLERERRINGRIRNGKLRKDMKGLDAQIKLLTNKINDNRKNRAVNALRQKEIDELKKLQQQLLDRIAENNNNEPNDWENQQDEIEDIINETINNSSLNNAPLNNAPLNNAPLNNAPLNNSPLNNDPLNNAPLNNSPLNNAPLNNAPLNNEPLNLEGFMNIEPFDSLDNFYSL